MDWSEAKTRIRESVRPGTDINTCKCAWTRGSNYRIVKACDDQAIRVPIGKTNVAKISWSMLERCFKELNGPNGYGTKEFKTLYPKESPCHVHVVGQIFAQAGLARVDRFGRYHPL